MERAKRQKGEAALMLTMPKAYKGEFKMRKCCLETKTIRDSDSDAAKGHTTWKRSRSSSV